MEIEKLSDNLVMSFDKEGNMWLTFNEMYSIKILAEQALKMGSAIFNHFYGEDNPMRTDMDKAYSQKQYEYCTNTLNTLNKDVAPNTWQIMNNYKKRLEEQINK